VLVRTIEYLKGLKDTPLKATPLSRKYAAESARDMEAIRSYREGTGRDPAPILTPQQRDYVKQNQHQSETTNKRWTEPL
jgi:hypothetical protein